MQSFFNQNGNWTGAWGQSRRSADHCVPAAAGGSVGAATSGESLDEMGKPTTDRRGRLLQSATVPYRLGPRGGLQVLLITSKETRRWVLPKGMIEEGMTARRSALAEAFEEAGVSGHVGAQALGHYTYRKARRRGWMPCIVEVFPLQVRVIHRDWPERSQRQRAWMDPRAAAACIREPELGRILVAFPDRIGRMRQAWGVC
jgi:8-oxo-dGTP pyrophosphatase MutT (NUDIX family)